MSHLFTAPEALASTAADVGGIGSAISTAGSNASGPTTGLLAAAQDEVSAAIANLFGGYGREYQAALARSAIFHSQFAQTLAGAGSAYAEAEAGNATLMGAAGGSSGPSVLTSAAQSASGDPLYALVMGGTW